MITMTKIKAHDKIYVNRHKFHLKILERKRSNFFHYFHKFWDLNTRREIYLSVKSIIQPADEAPTTKSLSFSAHIGGEKKAFLSRDASLFFFLSKCLLSRQIYKFSYQRFFFFLKTFRGIFRERVKKKSNFDVFKIAKRKIELENFPSWHQTEFEMSYATVSSTKQQVPFMSYNDIQIFLWTNLHEFHRKQGNILCPVHTQH